MEIKFIPGLQTYNVQFIFIKAVAHVDVSPSDYWHKKGVSSLFACSISCVLLHYYKSLIQYIFSPSVIAIVSTCYLSPFFFPLIDQFSILTVTGRPSYWQYYGIFHQYWSCYHDIIPNNVMFSSEAIERFLTQCFRHIHVNFYLLNTWIYVCSFL